MTILSHEYLLDENDACQHFQINSIEIEVIPVAFLFAFGEFDFRIILSICNAQVKVNAKATSSSSKTVTKTKTITKTREKKVFSLPGQKYDVPEEVLSLLYSFHDIFFCNKLVLKF